MLAVPIRAGAHIRQSSFAPKSYGNTSFSLQRSGGNRLESLVSPAGILRFAVLQKMFWSIFIEGKQKEQNKYEKYINAFSLQFEFQLYVLLMITAVTLLTQHNLNIQNLL